MFSSARAGPALRVVYITVAYFLGLTFLGPGLWLQLDMRAAF